VVGFPEDYAEAVKWYGKAAEQGDADAQGFAEGRLPPNGAVDAIALFIDRKVRQAGAIKTDRGSDEIYDHVQ